MWSTTNSVHARGALKRRTGNEENEGPNIRAGRKKVTWRDYRVIFIPRRL